MLLTLRRQALLFTVAIQFLTRLPTPQLPGFRTQWLAQSARYFPLVGALVGLLNVVAWWLTSLVFPPFIAVGLMLVASLLVTGALHEDGFTDACDGFGGGADKDRVLAIMKDSRIGAYGVISIVLLLGLKWSALTALPSAVFPLWVVSAHMFSRWCATGLIWRLVYVRMDDAAPHGAKARAFADGLGVGTWVSSGLMGAFAVVAVVLLGRLWPGGLAPAALPTAVLAAAGIACVAGSYCRQRLGGYTGDCLGAVQQLAELGFLLGGLAALRRA